MDDIISKVKLIATHDQVFHADDVFAVATLKQIFPKAKIIRTRDKAKLAECDLLIDIGGEYDHAKLRYDHHHKDFSETHSNGILRSGFGLIWKHYGNYLTGSDYVTQKIDETLVATIDALDNGQALYEDIGYGTPTHTITDFIENHNPIGHNLSADDYNLAFFSAVPMASEYLNLLIAKYKAKELDNKLFLDIYSKTKDKQIVVMDTALDCGEVEIAQPDLLYVVYPRLDGSWNVKSIAVDENHRFDNKLPFPEDWRGKRDEELRQVCGVKTAKFCHRTGFMAVAETREDAILLANKSLELQPRISNA